MLESTPKSAHNGFILGVPMSDWFISEEGNPEDGYTWNLLKKEGPRAVLIGQCFDERYAEELLEAAKWREAFLSGMVKLAMDGVVIDAATGLPWKRPEDLKSWDIKFTSPRTRAKTKKPRG